MARQRVRRAAARMIGRLPANVEIDEDAEGGLAAARRIGERTGGDRRVDRDADRGPVHGQLSQQGASPRIDAGGRTSIQL